MSVNWPLRDKLHACDLRRKDFSTRPRRDETLRRVIIHEDLREPFTCDTSTATHAEKTACESSRKSPEVSEC